MKARVEKEKKLAKQAEQIKRLLLTANSRLDLLFPLL